MSFVTGVEAQKVWYPGMITCSIHQESEQSSEALNSMIIINLVLLLDVEGYLNVFSSSCPFVPV
jgi:hypothetical protein